MLDLTELPMFHLLLHKFHVEQDFRPNHTFYNHTPHVSDLDQNSTYFVFLLDSIQKYNDALRHCMSLLHKKHVRQRSPSWDESMDHYMNDSYGKVFGNGL